MKEGVSPGLAAKAGHAGEVVSIPGCATTELLHGVAVQVSSSSV